MTDYQTLKLFLVLMFKRNSQYRMLGIRPKTVTYKKMESSSHIPEHCEQKATIGIVKSTHKILPRHNGVVPIKIALVKQLEEYLGFFYH